MFIDIPSCSQNTDAVISYVTTLYTVENSPFTGFTYSIECVSIKPVLSHHPSRSHRTTTSAHIQSFLKVYSSMSNQSTLSGFLPIVI